MYQFTNLKKKRIAILGASYLQKPLVQKARDMGLETHVFAWREGNVVEDICDFYYDISILDKEGILTICEHVGIHGIITVGSDLAIETIHFVAKKLNLITNSGFTCKYSRDKLLMRRLFKENGLPTVMFKKIDDIKDFEVLGFNYPIMIKATDRSGSRGINYAENINEAKIAFIDSYEESISKNVICEEYFDGKQYSVEMISQKGQHYFVGITSEFYSGPPNFVEIGHIVPGNIESDLLKLIVEKVTLALNFLKIEYGASHSEIRVNDNGDLCFIEIASRMGGDFRDLMVFNSYGYDYLLNSIRVALNEEIEIPINNPHSYSFIFWVLTEKDKSKIPSIIDNYEIIDIRIPTEVSNIKPEIKNSAMRQGYILAKHSNYPEAIFSN